LDPFDHFFTGKTPLIFTAFFSILGVRERVQPSQTVPKPTNMRPCGPMQAQKILSILPDIPKPNPKWAESGTSRNAMHHCYNIGPINTELRF